MKNRKLLGSLAAVVLAIVGTIVLVSYVQSAHRRTAATEPTTNVLVVTGPVAEGAPASSLAKSVKLTPVPRNVLASGAVSSLTSLGNRVAAVPLVTGEQVASSLFVSASAAGSFPVPAGLLQVTVSLSPDRALAGLLQPGETVAFLASFSSGAGSSTGPTTHMILQHVLITNVSIPGASTGGVGIGSSSSAKSVPGGNVYVTLALSAPEVEQVVFTAEHGTMWLASDPANASGSGTQVQTLGTVDS